MNDKAVCRTAPATPGLSNNVSSQSYHKSLHALLDPKPCLEGDLPRDTANPPVCHQPGHVSVLQWFWGTSGSKDQQHVFGHAGLLCEFFFTVVALDQKAGQGSTVADDLVPPRISPVRHDKKCTERYRIKCFLLEIVFVKYGEFYWVLFVLTSSWWEEPFSRSCRWKRQEGRNTRESWPSGTPLPSGRPESPTTAFSSPQSPPPPAPSPPPPPPLSVKYTIHMNVNKQDQPKLQNLEDYYALQIWQGTKRQKMARLKILTRIWCRECPCPFFLTFGFC